MVSNRILATLALSVLIACGDGKSPARTCLVDSECESGVCDPAGVCTRPSNTTNENTNTNTSNSNENQNSNTTNANSNVNSNENRNSNNSNTNSNSNNNTNSSDTCAANLDGVIERDEVSFETGVAVPYSRARDVTFDSAGTVDGDGIRRWDFTVSFPGAEAVSKQFQPTSEFWFYETGDNEHPYASSTHSIEALGNDDVLGVYRAGEDSLALLGVADREDGFSYTRLYYDTPLTTLEFPLTVGDSWLTETYSWGAFNGAVSAYWSAVSLRGEVDAAGEVITNYGTFDALRVKTVLTQQTGVFTTTVTTYAFVAECFGTIAWVLSEDGVDGDEFTSAAEVGRLEP